MLSTMSRKLCFESSRALAGRALSTRLAYYVGPLPDGPERRPDAFRPCVPPRTAMLPLAPASTTPVTAGVQAGPLIGIRCAPSQWSMRSASPASWTSSIRNGPPSCSASARPGSGVRSPHRRTAAPGRRRPLPSPPAASAVPGRPRGGASPWSLPRPRRPAMTSSPWVRTAQPSGRPGAPPPSSSRTAACGLIRVDHRSRSRVGIAERHDPVGGPPAGMPATGDRRKAVAASTPFTAGGVRGLPTAIRTWSSSIIGLTRRHGRRTVCVGAVTGRVGGQMTVVRGAAPDIAGVDTTPTESPVACRPGRFRP